MIRAVIAIDADPQGVCIIARATQAKRNGRRKMWVFSATRPDPSLRVMVPAWVDRALMSGEAQVIIEGGKTGSNWLEFVAWCRESDKPVE